MSESDKRIAPFGLRIPPELKDRVQDAARHSNQSLNALIVSVLEQAFPAPTINLHDLAAFLTGVMGEAEDGDPAYIDGINAVLAKAETPWTMKYEDGLVVFYPFATRSGKVILPKAEPGPEEPVD